MRFEDDDPARRNALAYPMELGGQKFELVEVKQQKDLMLNVARLHAQQEYDRIMEMVAVLQKQAAQLQRRLAVTDLVHAAEYKFQLFPGQAYWLARDRRRGVAVLLHLGPRDWTTGPPEDTEYVARVRWMGDFTWVEEPHPDLPPVTPAR
jgi:hypothetical protein